ncbi:MAG TPA: hypothetical protein VIG99_14665 [Myxococcaceae bacterium]|jgi:hypothetical protein
MVHLLVALVASQVCDPRASTSIPPLAQQVQLFEGVSPALAPLTLRTPVQRSFATARPTFTWDFPQGADLVAVAVFREPPRYLDEPDVISNFDADTVAWAWHSNLDPTAPGNVATWDQGRRVQDTTAPGQPQLSDEVPPDLVRGQAYYWAAWAWTGAHLSHASEVRAFMVGEDGITGGACFGDETLCAPPGGPLPTACIAGDYCAIICGADSDCVLGMRCDTTPSRLGHGVCRPSLDLECGCDADAGEKCDPLTCLCQRPPPHEAGCGCVAAPGSMVGALVLLWWIARRHLFAARSASAACAAARRATGIRNGEQDT